MHVWFQGMTALVMNSYNSWELTSCSPLTIKLMFRNMSPFSRLTSKQIKKLVWRKNKQRSMLVSRFAYFSILKTEAICFSETSVEFHYFTQRYNPEATCLHSHALLFIFSYNIHPLQNSTMYKLTREKHYLRNISVFLIFIDYAEEMYSIYKFGITWIKSAST
jgi:hypothetical protein